jgi:hypothetical protein
MRNSLYIFLTISIIFAACKKEEEVNNPPASPSIVGVWTPTSVVSDSSVTVTMGGIVIDSLSGSGSITMNPNEAGIEGNLEFTNNGEMFVDGDTLDYVYSNNTLTLTDDDSTFSIPCSVSQMELSLQLFQMSMDTSWVDILPISISVTFSQTIYCSRNTIIDTDVSQRIGYTTNSWFVKPQLNNIFKNFK